MKQSQRTDSTRHCSPRLQLTMAPLRQVVHVLEKLWPSHHAWGRVRGHEVGAGTFWVRTHFLAHVHANTGQLVLHLHAVTEVLSEASFFVLRTLPMNTGERYLGTLLQLGCLLRPCLELTT